MTIDKTQQHFDELFAKWRREADEWDQHITKTYDPKIMKPLGRFMYGLNDVSLDSLCNEETENLLFRNDSYPLIQQDEPSMTRKQKYRDGSLFCTYYYADPTDANDLQPHTNVDIIASKKEISPLLRETLGRLGFSADSIIDFETLEFPHFLNESYYGQKCSTEVRELCRNLNINGKEIASQFKKGNSPLYRETEKIHIQFAAGKNKNGNVQAIPVYIGIGTNEPYGLTFNGSLGKSRFMKFKFDDPNSGIERGELEEIVISPEQFKEKFGNKTTRTTLSERENWKLYSLTDEEPSDKYLQFEGVTFDEDRFKGFLKIYKQGGQERGRLITPNFSCQRITQKDYFSALLQRTVSPGFQTICNSKQILGLLNNTMITYDDFAAVQFEPRYIVKKFGMENVFKAVSSKLDGGDFFHVDAINIASDAYIIGTFSWERLRVSSLIVGNYIRSGRFDELVKNTYLGKNTKPL
jgi:hypothetical protein